MPLPDTGKISHKDIMTEFEHPRADFKLSGDGAPILQRGTNAKVAESDFYGAKKGGDIGGANFGQVIVPNTTGDGNVITTNGYQWQAMHSSVGFQYAAGGEKVVRSFAPKLRVNRSVFTEDLAYFSTSSVQRNFGSAGGGTHGNDLEGYFPQYNGNYSGQSINIQKNEGFNMDPNAGQLSSGATGVAGMSFNGCCSSPHGTCYPSPCKSNGDAGGILHAPAARFYVGFGTQQQKSSMYKVSTDGTTFNYPKPVGYQGWSTAYVAQGLGATGLLNKIIGVTATGGWYIWDNAGVPRSGNDTKITGVNLVTKFKGKFYYASARQNVSASQKRIFRSNNFPPTEIDSNNNLSFDASPSWVRLFRSPDENALIYGSQDANGKCAWYATTDGVTWTRTYTSAAPAWWGPITSQQLWHPETF